MKRRFPPRRNASSDQARRTKMSKDHIQCWATSLPSNLPRKWPWKNGHHEPKNETLAPPMNSSKDGSWVNVGAIQGGHNRGSYPAVTSLAQGRAAYPTSHSASGGR